MEFEQSVCTDGGSNLRCRFQIRKMFKAIARYQGTVRPR